MLQIKNFKYRLLIVVLALCLIAWGLIFLTDYWYVTYVFERPVFAICVLGADDGGSGTYKGFGYSIEIEGNFMPEDEFYGVTHAVFSLFGREIKTVTRD